MAMSIQVSAILSTCWNAEKTCNAHLQGNLRCPCLGNLQAQLIIAGQLAEGGAARSSCGHVP